MLFVRLFLISILLFLEVSLFSQVDLYPIEVDGKYGYINSKGETVIPPKYFYAGTFVEGLAEVREHGLYGFIDSTGEYAILPAFDYAYPFLDGVANVHFKGKKCFVDKNGKKLFLDVDGHVSRSGAKDLFIYHKYPKDGIQSVGNKYALINKDGDWLTDTVFRSIKKFNNGLASVTGKNGEFPVRVDGVGDRESGVIDTNGNFIINYGKFLGIDEFQNGVAWATWDEGKGKNAYEVNGLIDSKGRVLFNDEDQDWDTPIFQSGFHDGLLNINIYFDKERDGRETYSAVINKKGKIVLSDENWVQMTSFKHGRAFVQLPSGNWNLIDTKGTILNKDTIQEILFPVIQWKYKNFFLDGIEPVKVNGTWTTIDVNGNLGDKELRKEYTRGKLERRGDFVIIKIESESKAYKLKYGCWNIKTGAVLLPKYDFLYETRPGSHLLYARQGRRTFYLNRNFNSVWQSEDHELIVRKLNIDFMKRAYFYASSPSLKELERWGGWGGSKNGMSKNNSNLPNNGELQILIDTNSKEKIYNKYESNKILLLNNSHDTIYFDAQDSRLYMNFQAKDQDGVWKDIEYIPNSWCGNSYHTLYLPPDYHWSFISPKYEGSFQTKLRVKLVYKRNYNSEDENVLYSNEINGSVNPGQFTVKLPYQNRGIMDPYDE